MSDDVQRSLGEISGKLDGLLRAVQDHAAEDTRRFDAVGKVLMQHSEDINQAKGAKSALLLAGAAVSALVAGCAAFVEKVLLK